MKKEVKKALKSMNEEFETQKKEMMKRASTIREKIIQTAKEESDLDYYGLNEYFENNEDGLNDYVISVKTQIFCTARWVGKYLSSKEKARLLDMGLEMENLYNYLQSEITGMMVMYDALEESGLLD